MKVLYFTAQWCGPCRAFGPILYSLIEELKESVQLEKIDADENPDMVSQYQIRSFPTIVMLKDGKEVARHSGLAPKEKLKGILTNAINQG